MPVDSGTRSAAGRAFGVAVRVAAGLAVVVSSALAAAGPRTLAATDCTPAGASHLTARVIARPGATITGLVDAAGCDIGVYVPADASGAVIRHATVRGATDQGILVQDASGVIVEDNTVTGNLRHPDVCPFVPGVAPKGPCIVDAKAVELVGTTHAVVKGNLIVNNLGEGGIGVFDDGVHSPATLGKGLARPSQDNLIEDNVVVDNPRGCGIVVSSHVAGEDVVGNRVLHNTVIGDAEGVVVADNVPHTRLVGTRVVRNVATDNLGPGVVLNSLAPGDVVTGTLIEDNVLSRNGGLPPFEKLPGYTSNPTGLIAVTAGLPPGTPRGTPAPVQQHVRIVDNVISGEHYGVWLTPQNHFTFVGTTETPGTVNRL